MTYPDPYALNRIQDDADDARRRTEWQQRANAPYKAVAVLAAVAGALIVAMAVL